MRRRFQARDDDDDGRILGVAPIAPNGFANAHNAPRSNVSRSSGRGKLIVTYAGLLHGSLGGEVNKLIAKMI